MILPRIEISSIVGWPERKEFFLASQSTGIKRRGSGWWLDLRVDAVVVEL